LYKYSFIGYESIGSDNKKSGITITLSKALGASSYKLDDSYYHNRQQKKETALLMDQKTQLKQSIGSQELARRLVMLRPLLPKRVYYKTRRLREISL
jgi:hypothetical protein